MSALKKVPDGLSFLKEAEQAWQIITKQILDSKSSTQANWSHVDRLLAQARSDFEREGLDPEYDWEPDVSAAESYHALQISWAMTCFRQLEKMENTWRQMTDKAESFVQELAIAGIKLAFVAHGTIGLGCLTVLGQDSPNIPRSLLVFCIVCALLGIALIAIGVILIVETAPVGISYVSGRLNSTNSYVKFIRLSRVWKSKIEPKLSLSNYFIYGSIGWLLFYVFVAMIVLLHM